MAAVASRVYVRLTPYIAKRLERLRHAGVAEGARPRPAAAVVVEAVAFKALWLDAHPGESLEQTIEEWRRRVSR